MSRGGLLSLLVRRNGLLILAFTAAGLLQWGYIKIVALNQSVDEFGRFVALLHLALILTTPLVSLQGAISRQVAALIAGGRRDAVLPYLHRRLRSWVAPIGGVVALVLATAWPLAGGLDLGSPVALVLLAGILLVYLPFQACLGVLAGSERYRGMAALLVFETGLRCLIALALPDGMATTIGALAASLVAVVAAVVVGLAMIRPEGTPASDPDASISRVLPAFLLGALAFAALAYQESVLVRLVLSAEDAGRYSAALAISRLLLVLVYPMVPAMVPLVTRRHAAGEPTRRILLFQFVVLSGPVTLALVAARIAPDEMGRVLLGGEKHSGLGDLLRPAFVVSSLLAAMHLSMHYLLALRRVAVVPLLFGLAGAGAVLILASPADPVAVLHRMVGLAGGAFVIVAALAFAGPQRSVP